MTHWPEKLLAGLGLIVTPLLIIFSPGKGIIKVLLIPVGFAITFILWMAVIWIVCKFQSKSDQ
jgi:hypothetical protein